MPGASAAGRLVAIAAVLVAAGCAPGRQNVSAVPPPSPAQPAPESGLQEFASGIAEVFPGTQVLSASPGAGKCPQGDVPVVHIDFPEHVLFAPASDQPGQAAGPVLDFLATSLLRDTPTAEVTVLGHTDAGGSDTYNLDLSRRRAQSVMRALIGRGFPAGQLSTVAVGKRQPLADDTTAEGRARNRRVEFLISRCLAGNLEIVRQVTPAYGPAEAAVANSPVEVLRLDPDGLRRVDTVSLQVAEPRPAAVPRLRPPAGPARSTASPAYLPRTLAPAVETAPLGPAISY